MEGIDSLYGPGSKYRPEKGNGSSVTVREMDNSKRTVVVTGLSSSFSHCCFLCGQTEHQSEVEEKLWR